MMQHSIRNLPLLLTGGLLIGAGCSLFFSLVFAFRKVPPQARLLDFFIPLVVLVFMLILVRARKGEPSFHFWEGLLAGNFMLWTGGLFSGLFIFLAIQIEPEILSNFIASSERYLTEFNQYAAANQKIKDLDRQLVDLRNMKPSALILDEAVKKVWYSFLLVPFVSIIFRRK